MSSIFALGIDIGGTNFRMGAVGGDGRIYTFTRTSSSIFSHGNAVEILKEEIEAQYTPEDGEVDG